MSFKFADKLFDFFDVLNERLRVAFGQLKQDLFIFDPRLAIAQLFAIIKHEIENPAQIISYKGQFKLLFLIIDSSKQTRSQLINKFPSLGFILQIILFLLISFMINELRNDFINIKIIRLNDQSGVVHVQ